jgi:hypothetical protein
MPPEREFLRQRLALVEQQLANPNQEFIRDDEGRLRYRTRPVSRRDITRGREARLLRKLLARIREGQVLKALQDWRRQLGTFLTKPRRRHAKAQEAYDAWCQLAPHQRRHVPKPPRPPSAL